MVGLSQDFIPNEENFLPWSWPSDHPVGDWHPNWLGPRLWCTTGSFQQICALRAILPLGRWFQVVPVTMCWTSQQLVTLPAAPEVVQMSDFYLYNQQIVVEGFDQATLGCAWSEYLRCRAFIRLVASFGSLNILWVSEIHRNPGIWDFRNTQFWAFWDCWLCQICQRLLGIWGFSTATLVILRWMAERIQWIWEMETPKPNGWTTAAMVSMWSILDLEKATVSEAKCHFFVERDSVR